MISLKPKLFQNSAGSKPVKTIPEYIAWIPVLPTNWAVLVPGLGSGFSFIPLAPPLFQATPGTPFSWPEVSSTYSGKWHWVIFNLFSTSSKSIENWFVPTNLSSGYPRFVPPVLFSACICAISYLKYNSPPLFLPLISRYGPEPYLSSALTNASSKSKVLPESLPCNSWVFFKTVVKKGFIDGHWIASGIVALSAPL